METDIKKLFIYKHKHNFRSQQPFSVNTLEHETLTISTCRGSSWVGSVDVSSKWIFLFSLGSTGPSEGLEVSIICCSLLSVSQVSFESTLSQHIKPQTHTRTQCPPNSPCYFSPFLESLRCAGVSSLISLTSGFVSLTGCVKSRRGTSLYQPGGGKEAGLRERTCGFFGGCADVDF